MPKARTKELEEERREKISNALKGRIPKNIKIIAGWNKGKLEAHHILSWSKFPELRYEVNNGITLCHFHHPRKRNDEMTLSPFFQSLVKVKEN